MLKLFYITNNPKVAEIAEESGVDRIWIDLEYIGKELRQPKILNTVISHHSINDIKKIKKVLKKSDLMVRINSIYSQSEEEINKVIEAGANVIMLPYFKTIKEIKDFLNFVNKRAKTCLLVETVEAVDLLDDIVKLEGIDEIHIGLNDLHLEYDMKFMFELLTDGTVEKICNKVKKHNLPYGFGGVGRIGEGTLPAENIIAEHYRLGSSMVILSRSFCDVSKINDLNEIRKIFKQGVRNIRNFENELLKKNDDFFKQNYHFIEKKVNEIIKNIN